MSISVLASAATLNKIVVFGDSLSDNGNLYEYMKHQFPSSPPYFQGRMSNGPVWAELLAASYFPNDPQAHFFDYAYGGASVEDVHDEEPMFTLRSEIDSYFLANDNVADDRALYMLWVGANNYLALPDDMEQSVQIVTDGIERSLQRLAEKGAQHILVLNMPDLGRIPLAREFDAVSQMTQLSKMHNKQLLKTLDSLKARYPSVQWLHFDVEGSLNEMLDYPAKSGFSNVNDSCLDSTQPDPSLKSALQIAATVESNASEARCDGYLFFDLVHPSGFAHQVLANRTRLLLDEAGIELSIDP
jgi:phospholipase/lecithinase/hemolysin